MPPPGTLAFVLACGFVPPRFPPLVVKWPPRP
jgi:hypothetical protein